MPNTLAQTELEQNKKTALNLAALVVDGDEHQKDRPQEYNLTTVIEDLSEEKDLQNNIFWHVQKDQLIRDGRKSHNPPIVTTESYVIQYLNNVRGAISLVEDPKLRKKLETEALKEADSLLNIDDTKALEKEIIVLNTNLALELMNNGITNADSKIKIAKDYAGLKDKHYHVTTLSTALNDDGKEVTVIESEIKTSRLTEKQQEMFADLPNQNWYQKMPKWEQKLVKENFMELISGEKVIPTQLRNSIPLLRNAYRKMLAIKLNGQKLEVILETSHSGALSSHTKGDNTELTRQNIEQIQQYAPDGEVHLNSLLSPINQFDEDAHDAATTTKAMSSMKGVIKSTTPYNFFRTWANGGGRDLSGSKTILENLGNLLQKHKGYNTIVSYLQCGKEPVSIDPNKKAVSVEKQLAKIKIKNPKLAQLLQTAVDTRKDIDSLSIFSGRKDKENTHARIAANMKLISYNAKPALTIAFPNMNLKNIPLMHSFCKSGKDRTQMLEIETSQRALNQAIGSKNSEANLQTILSARSAANLAGTQGGTPGCDSIRPSTANDANKTMFGKITHYVSDNRAKFNKFAVDKIAIKLTILKQNISSFINSSKTMSKMSNAFSSTTKLSSKSHQR